jgi:transposase-like protein
MTSSSDSDSHQARLFLESVRWPDGRPRCPHCGWSGACYLLTPHAGSTTRDRVWRCGDCRKQFTVTVKTMFEGTKLPLSTWLRGIALLCSRPGGWTVRDLQKELGLSYRGAWALTDRIRYAITQKPFPHAGRIAPGLLRAPGPASLYPLTVPEAAACLLAIVPERKHPLATDRRTAAWESRDGK